MRLCASWCRSVALSLVVALVAVTGCTREEEEPDLTIPSPEESLEKARDTITKQNADEEFKKLRGEIEADR